MARYMKAKGRAESYIAETRRIFDKDVLPKWGARDIRSITRADVIDLLDTIVDDGRPIQANRTLAAVRKLLNWSLDRSISTPARLRRCRHHRRRPIASACCQPTNCGWSGWQQRRSATRSARWCKC